MTGTVAFVWERGWKIHRTSGTVDLAMRDHVEPRRFTVASEAIEQHYQDCKGGWVEPGMREPYVSALSVMSGGIKTGERRPGVDLDEVVGRDTELAHR